MSSTLRANASFDSLDVGWEEPYGRAALLRHLSAHLSSDMAKQRYIATRAFMRFDVVPVGFLGAGRHSHVYEVATSEQIATSANTNPVVIRRLLGELRRAGLVESRRGVGAGWSLAREPGSMTLLDVYEAVEPGPLFAMHRTTPDQGCVVGHGIQPAMQDIYEGIEETVRHELARVTLEDVLRNVLATPR